MSNPLTCQTCPAFVDDKGIRCRCRNWCCDGTWDISLHKQMNGDQLIVMGDPRRRTNKGVSLFASRFR